MSKDAGWNLWRNVSFITTFSGTPKAHRVVTSCAATQVRGFSDLFSVTFSTASVGKGDAYVSTGTG